MSIHKLHQTIPDLSAVEDQAEQAFERLAMVLDSLRLCHLTDPELLEASRLALAASERAFKLSLQQ